MNMLDLFTTDEIADALTSIDCGCCYAHDTVDTPSKINAGQSNYMRVDSGQQSILLPKI
jgi:hypothetical protein